VFKFANERSEELIKLQEELNSAFQELDGTNLLAETKIKLDETKKKYLTSFDNYFDVSISK